MEGENALDFFNRLFDLLRFFTKETMPFKTCRCLYACIKVSSYLFWLTDFNKIYFGANIPYFYRIHYDLSFLTTFI